MTICLGEALPLMNERILKMKIKWHQLVLCACSTLVLVSCGPQKKEEATTPEQTQEVPPSSQDEEMRILEQKESPMPPSQESTLTPQQQKHLKIDEENVFDETPPG